MGECYGKNSEQVVPLIVNDKGTQVQSTELEHNNITISYCAQDFVPCCALADYLIADGFRVQIDRDKPNTNDCRPTIKAIDASDCLLICVSNFYFHSRSCQKEVLYASKKQKPIIPVQLDWQFEVRGWLTSVIDGKIVLKFSDEKNKFVFSYKKLVEQIVSHTVMIFSTKLSEKKNFRQNFYVVCFSHSAQAYKTRTTCMMVTTTNMN